jgi:hypothetical protein
MNKHWLCSLLLLGCGSRPEAWDASFTPSAPVGLDNAVVVMDTTLARALVLTSPGALELREDVLPVGQHVVKAQASPDGKRLFVLSRGIWPRRNASDEHPRLTVIETDPAPRVVKTYEFDDPLSGLVVDSENEWAVLYVTSGDSRTVTNPNEIFLLHLSELDRDPIPVTVQSLTGSPQSFSFTSTLDMPNGEARRLLVVEMQNEVTLVDLLPSLGDVERTTSQVTIQMSLNQQGQNATPAEVVFHDADAASGLDPQLAVRLQGDTNVMLLPLVAPSSSSTRPFSVVPNLVDVGGQASTIRFVNTDDGVRLAALVPSKPSAGLVDPSTGNVTSITLTKPFTGIALVTAELATDASGTDIALLWSNTTPTIGLWDLGKATTAATHGIDTLQVGASVRDVLNVPGDAFPTSKILEAQSGDFYVLDLKARRSSPMVTNGHTYQLTFAPDGRSRRLWAFAPSGEDFSSVELGTLNPTELHADSPVWNVFDIAQSGSAGGRTAVVLHHSGAALGATVLDAVAPDTANTRFYSGLAYGGLSHE